MALVAKFFTRRSVTTSPVSVGMNLPPMRVGTNFRINADVIIAPTGLVSEVRLSQSSGLRDFDDQLVQTLRMRRYLPALIDGFPITSWWRTDGRTMQL